MIKPPFTVLLLKDSQSPIAIRITKGIFVFFLSVFVILIFLSVNGLVSIFTTEGLDRFSVSDDFTKAGNPKYIFVEEKIESKNDDSENISPGIKDIAIRKSSDRGVEISFMFENMGTDNEVFVWILLNPDGLNENEIIVYPRSPIFRGLPVDFRNGILHETVGGKPFRISFSGSQAGIALRKLRILAYSLDGKIVIDKAVVSQPEERK